MSEDSEIHKWMFLLVLIGFIMMGIYSSRTTPPPTAPICLRQDEVTSIKDEYTGSWHGTVRHTKWTSGAETDERATDDIYVGKILCREWSRL